MRADVALSLFADDAPMTSHGASDFFGIVEGIDSLTTHLYECVRAAGGTLRNHHTVDDIRYSEDQKQTQNQNTLLDVKGTKNAKQPFQYRARRVVIATPYTEFGRFTVLRNAPMLRQLTMSKLLRIYAVYPAAADGKVWFATIPKTVTTNPLRYVIPINPKTGLIMISYTEGPDSDVWRAKEGKELETAIQTSVRALFPSHDIPAPVFLKKHDWTAGCTYWLPGEYDVPTASRQAHNPAPNVYVCGESVSQTQTWLEGALESAEVLMRCLE